MQAGERAPPVKAVQSDLAQVVHLRQPCSRPKRRHPVARCSPALVATRTRAGARRTSVLPTDHDKVTCGTAHTQFLLASVSARASLLDRLTVTA
jgi:hypothetical protein